MSAAFEPVEARPLVVDVGGDLRFSARELTPALLHSLDLALRVKNPKHVAAVKRGVSTRDLEEWLPSLRRSGDVVSIPRGAASALVAMVGRPVRWQTKALVEAFASFPYEGKLRPYQVEAVETAVRCRGGVIVAPCGAGKTEIGLAMLSRLERRALVLVPSLDLVDQWAERAQARGVEGVGRIGGGKFTVGEGLTVATLQTAAKRVDELAPLFGSVLVDECHHTPAETLSNLIAKIPARYRYGLTATPTREDTLTPVVEWTLGKQIYRIAQRTLEDVGAVVRPTYEKVASSFSFPYRSGDDWPALLEALAADEARLLLVGRVACEASRRTGGGVVLLLTGRVDHAEALGAVVTALGAPGRVMTGDMRKKDRAAFLDEARAGACRVLVATQLADEGLDVPRLSSLVLAWPGKAEGRLVQRIGRVLRPHAEKDERPAVIDIVDPLVGVLANQAKKRERIFVQTWGRT